MARVRGSKRKKASFASRNRLRANSEMAICRVHETCVAPSGISRWRVGADGKDRLETRACGQYLGRIGKREFWVVLMARPPVSPNSPPLVDKSSVQPEYAYRSDSGDLTTETT